MTKRQRGRLLRGALLVLATASVSCRSPSPKQHALTPHEVAPQTLPTATIKAEDMSTIPFGYASDYSEMNTHRGPVIPVVSDSFTPHRVNFLIDTGAANTTIVRPVVARFPVKTFGRMQTVRLPEYSIGDYHHYGTMEVFSRKQFDYIFSDSMHGGNYSIGGILGENILAPYPCLFDFRHKRFAMIYRKNNRAPLSVSDLVFLGFAPDKTIMVPIYLSKDYVYEVDVRVGDKPYRLTLDTGAGDIAIVDKAEYAKQKRANAKKSWSRSFWENQVGYLTSQTVTVGGAPGITATVEYNETTFSNGNDPQFQGSLGSNYLSHFRVLMDFPNGKLYLMPI